jgi:hypothetical protein
LASQQRQTAQCVAGNRRQSRPLYRQPLREGLGIDVEPFEKFAAIKLARRGQVIRRRRLRENLKAMNINLGINRRCKPDPGSGRF